MSAAEAMVDAVPKNPCAASSPIADPEHHGRRMCARRRRLGIDLGAPDIRQPIAETSTANVLAQRKLAARQLLLGRSAGAAGNAQVRLMRECLQVARQRELHLQLVGHGLNDEPHQGHSHGTKAAAHDGKGGNGVEQALPPLLVTSGGSIWQRAHYQPTVIDHTSRSASLARGSLKTV